jgi:hypothetical protein
MLTLPLEMVFPPSSPNFFRIINVYPFLCMLSLPQEIKMFDQPLEVCPAAQEARRVVAKAESNAAPALQLAASLPSAALFPNPNDMATVSTANMATGVIPLLPMLAWQRQRQC